MAAIDLQRTEPLVDVTGFRLSWGAIFAGFVVATVTQIVLSVLGMAIGFSVWDPRTGGYAGVGIGAAIWFAATAIVSLFLGGLVLGRLAGVLKTKDGMLHGVVMWGLSTLLAVWMVVNGVGALFGTTLNIVARTGTAVIGGAVTATGAAGAAVANRPAGEPAIPQRVQNAYDTLQTRMQAEMQQLPPTDTLAARAGRIGAATTDAVAATAWLSLLTMALSLGAAVWGAAITAKR